MLHDTIEDTSATREEIDRLFGPRIGKLVEGLTKIKKLDLVSKKAAQGENFRKLLLAVSEDIRVLLIKLADRLHNMRTLDHMAPEKRIRIAEETVDIYAPLAGRMGMQEIREELEELSFRHIKPDAWKTILDRLNEVQDKSSALIAEIERQLVAKLAESGVTARVTGRRKRPYSIWRKMERKSISFEQLSDLYGFRVVVGSVGECYTALGVVHTTWPMVPGRYKDYISTPKQNDYKSLHNTVVGPATSASNCRSAPRIWTASPNSASRAHATTRMGAPAPAPRPRGGLSRGSSARWTCWPKGDSPEEILEHTGWSCSRTRCSASRRKAC